MKTVSAHRTPEQSDRLRAAAQPDPSGNLLQRQVAVLSLLDCLRGVPAPLLERLAPLCTVRAFVPGTLVVSERMAGAFLYLVLRGTISLTLHDRAGHEVLLGVLDRGDCFGEGSLFADPLRHAAARTETVCYALQLPVEPTRALVAESPELAAALRATYRRRLIESALGRVPLFSQLTPLERARIADLLQHQHYERGVTILHEGSLGDALYLIEFGQVLVARAGQVIAHLAEGDFFGEMSLLSHEPHNADVRALTPVDVLALPAHEFDRLLERQPTLSGQVRSLIERRRAATTSLQTDHARVRRLSEAIDRGLLRGTHLLVRDPQQCAPGCHICRDACSTRHGQPRMQLVGPSVDGLDIVDTCRQCQFGAECVEVCPEHAIEWNNRGALIITGSCTGCGACVTACPYHAIQRVPLANGAGEGPLWSLWRRLTQPRIPTIPLEPAAPTHRADKCDLCHGYHDMACVTACPTGALRLVPVEEIFPL